MFNGKKNLKITNGYGILEIKTSSGVTEMLLKCSGVIVTECLTLTWSLFKYKHVWHVTWFRFRLFRVFTFQVQLNFTDRERQFCFIADSVMLLNARKNLLSKKQKTTYPGRGPNFELVGPCGVMWAPNHQGSLGVWNISQ